MYQVKTLNKISPVGLAHLTESYILTDKTEDADAILVRSQDGSLTPPSSKNLSKRCKRLIFLSIS